MAGVLPQRRGYSVRQIFDQIEGAPERDHKQWFECNFRESCEFVPVKTAYFFDKAARWDLADPGVVERTSVTNVPPTGNERADAKKFSLSQHHEPKRSSFAS